MERGLLLTIVLIIFLGWLVATIVYWLFRATQGLLATTTMLMFMNFSGRQSSSKREFERLLVKR